MVEFLVRTGGLVKCCGPFDKSLGPFVMFIIFDQSIRIDAPLNLASKDLCTIEVIVSVMSVVINIKY